MSIRLTERAVTEVKKVMESQGLEPEKTYLRVGINGGGCSGFSYALDLTQTKADADEVYDCDGVQVICDSQGHAHLNGTEIDYRDGLAKQGFAFNNPNATGSCGCGSSFSV